jgi:hypothetical protein
VSGNIYERGVPGGVFNLNSTSYPDHGHYGDLPLQGKIPTAEPGIEPGTSWLLVRSSDHQATRLISSINFYVAYYTIFNVVIMNIKIILYQLCPRTYLFTFILSVNRYSYMMVEICSRNM